MTLPTPKHPPDPDLLRVIGDVNAIAGEHRTPDGYFDRIGMHSGRILATLHPYAIDAAQSVYQHMYNNDHRLPPVDYLTMHTNAALMRGIAYGLELAKRAQNGDPTHAQ